VLCEILLITRSSYYKWLKHGETKEEKLNHELSQIILEYHDEFKGILGYRRMTLWINTRNQTSYNKKRIRRLMKLMGVCSVIRRKRKGYIKVRPEITAENVLNREFKAENPNEKWLTDVTEFKVIGSHMKLYLSAIIDLCDTSIISHKMGISNNNQLVNETFEKAFERNPEAKPLVHSDRGSQYTNKVFQKKLTSRSMTVSMSRVGRCVDNGPMEGFWGTLKAEMYYLNQFHDINQLKAAIDQYIRFYNEQRYQEKLKGLTPMAYRNQALKIESNI
jgi:putative transposase